MVRFLFTLTLSIFPLQLVAAENPDTDHFKRWQLGQENQRAFEHREFAEMGFASIAEAQVEGRDVRRAVMKGPYGIIDVPGLELERHANGSVTLLVRYYGWAVEPVVVDPAYWDELTAMDAEVFAPAVYVPPTNEPTTPARPRNVCHAWGARFAASMDRTESWSRCGGSEGTEYEYALIFVRAAMSTRPACEYDEERPFWSFSNCFQDRLELDDEELNAQFVEIRARYSEALDSGKLAEARRYISQDDLTIGSDEWLTARDMVSVLRRHDQVRQEQLQRLRRLFVGRDDVSQADRARVDRVIKNWSRSSPGYDRNTADLMRQLLWAGAVQ